MGNEMRHKTLNVRHRHEKYQRSHSMPLCEAFEVKRLHAQVVSPVETVLLNAALCPKCELVESMWRVNDPDYPSARGLALVFKMLGYHAP